jgi:hypothetical protein
MWYSLCATNTCCGTLPLLPILVRSPPTFPPYLTNIGLYFPPSSFRYSYAPPTITSLSPGTGPTSGFGADGQPILVTIRGSNFGKVNMVYIIYVIMGNMIGYVIWFTNTFGSYFVCYFGFWEDREHGSGGENHATREDPPLTRRDQRRTTAYGRNSRGRGRRRRSWGINGTSKIHYIFSVAKHVH